MPYPPDIDDANDFQDVRQPIGNIATPVVRVKRIRGIRSPSNRTVINTVTTDVIDLTELKVKSKKTGVTCQTYDTVPGVITSASPQRFRFVPEHETLTVSWKILSAPHVRDVEFSVYRRNAAHPLWQKRVHWDAGHCPETGSIEFNGDMKAVAPWTKGGKHRAVNVIPNYNALEFPDGFLTVEHAPYLLKMVVLDPGTGPLMAVSERWAYLDVVLDGLELSWGPQSVIPLTQNLPTNANNAVDRGHHAYAFVTDRRDNDNLNGALPQPGQTKKVYLSTNVFYQTEAELDANSSWERLYAHWGEGPNLPIFLTPGVSRSDHKRITGANAAKALGAMRFAWEWVDAAAAPNNAIHQIPNAHWNTVNMGTARGRALTFLQQALDFDQNVSEPPGQNCHVERGGKRGPGAPPVFPPHNGTGTFPFEVVNPATGNWCATSKVADAGPHAGKTGVVFQPSIQAGDGYTLRVAAVYDDNVDPTAAYNVFHTAVDNADAALKQDLGTFQVWRDVAFTAFSAQPGGFPQDYLDALIERMKGAFIRIRSAIVPPRGYFKSVERIYKGQLAAPPALEDYVHAAFVQNTSYTARAHAVYFQPYAAWKNEMVNLHGSLVNARAWARAHAHATRDFWRSGTTVDGMYPLCDPWPATFVAAPLPGTGVIEVDIQVTPNWGAPQQVTFPVPDLNNARATIKQGVYVFFSQTLLDKPYGHGVDPNLTVTLRANGGDQVALQNAFDLAIEDHFNDRSAAQYERALGYAWAWKVMALALEEMLDGVDGIRAGHFSQPSNLSPTPTGKAFPAVANRASAEIYLTPGSGLGTVLHEFGHSMFLNHPHFDGNYGVGDPRHLHDAAAGFCTMMTPSQDLNYCGFCLLRLRGWSVYELDNARAPVPAAVATFLDPHERTLRETGANNSR